MDKVKRFFSKGDSSMESTGKTQRRAPQQRRRVVSAAQVPGGFFNGDTSGISLSSIGNSAKTAQKSTAESIAEGSIDVSDVSISSNARLASFFAHKGDAPLSEMEMEGVLSLMKQTHRDETVSTTKCTTDETRENEHAYPGESSVLTNRRRALLRNTSSSSMQLPPRFTPRYESGNTGANRSVSFAASAASTTSTTRRVFDYTSLPAPYKASVFRYHSAANTPAKKVHSDKVKKQGQPKRVSNTASALLSLLNESQKPEKPGNSASSLANPYAGRVPRVSRAVEQEPEEPKAITKEPVMDKKESIEDEKETKREDAPIFLPKRQTKPEAATNAVPATSIQPFDQYKPTRSSSLRSAMTAQEKTPLIKEPVGKVPIIPVSVGKVPKVPVPVAQAPVAHVPIPQVQVAKEPVESAVKTPAPIPATVIKETTHIPQITTADTASSFTFPTPLPSNISATTDDASVQRYCALFTF